jgi:glycine/D-amino acid oxidase-like deaminating enzyme
MRFAILGAGFAGLAVTWHLLNYTKGTVTIDLYDPEPIGGGASGLSSGLFHAYTGKQAKKAWEADRCIQETHRLITVASKAAGKPVILSKGILRPALTPQQVEDFQKCVDEHSETEWWDNKTCEKKVQGLHVFEQGGGLFIKDGLTLDVQAYLQGLWKACALLGTQHHQQAMIRLSDFETYDRILFAIGPMTKNFPPLKDLPISAVKGQILELKWPEGVKPPPFSLVSQKYLVMRKDLKSCLVGSTYEHTFSTPQADKAKAYEEIMPHIISFFPKLAKAEILHCRAAFRATTPNHLPIVGKVADKYFFFTGLGSKGLLYHAWIGKRVARALLSNQTKHFPAKLYNQSH